MLHIETGVLLFDNDIYTYIYIYILLINAGGKMVNCFVNYVYLCLENLCIGFV